MSSASKEQLRKKLTLMQFQRMEILLQINCLKISLKAFNLPLASWLGCQSLHSNVLDFNLWIGLFLICVAGCKKVFGTEFWILSTESSQTLQWRQNDFEWRRWISYNKMTVEALMEELSWSKQPEGHSSMDIAPTCRAGDRDFNPGTTKDFSAPILSGTPAQWLSSCALA